MFSFFTRKSKENASPVTTDIHSHLLYGLDDGVKTMGEAEEVLRVFGDAGFRKIITTPHVMQDYYKNDREGIKGGLAQLQEFISKRSDIMLEAAAEYYLDESLMQKVGEKGLLTFGDRYLLFETNFISEPFHLKEFVFKATSSGYRPVLAHPERYQYLTLDKAEDLRDRGVIFQINSLSLIGYYSTQVQKMAQQLIDRGWVELMGSDCHTAEQSKLLPQAWKCKYYNKALSLPLLNNVL